MENQTLKNVGQVCRTWKFTNTHPGPPGDSEVCHRRGVEPFQLLLLPVEVGSVEEIGLHVQPVPKGEQLA